MNAEQEKREREEFEKWHKAHGDAFPYNGGLCPNRGPEWGGWKERAKRDKEKIKSGEDKILQLLGQNIYLEEKRKEAQEILKDPIKLSEILLPMGFVVVSKSQWHTCAEDWKRVKELENETSYMEALTRAKIEAETNWADFEIRLCRLVEAVEKLLIDLNNLINQSKGVDGLHLNGDVALWDELLEGGTYQEWLIQISKTKKVLEEVKE